MRRNMAVLGLVAAAAAPVAAVLLQGRHPYELRSEFADARGLRKNSDVKIGGVVVGKVASLRVTPRDTALAVLKFNDGTPPVGQDSRARIRSLNLLGEKYIDLGVGDRAHPAPSGTLIPRSRTSEPVELDQVIDVLEPSTRERFGVLLNEAGLALAGRGVNLRALLRAAPRGLENTAALEAQMAHDTHVLGKLLEASDRVVRSVSRERRGLTRLIDNAGGAFATMARRRAELGATLRETPGTLAQLRATLRRLDRTGSALRPAANGLRATAPPLAAALQALPGFRAAAEPALTEASATAPMLTRLAREATPIVRQLHPTAQSLDAFARDFGPLTDTLDGAGADLMAVLQGWTSAIQEADSVGRYFRISVVLSPSFRQALEAYIKSPVRARDLTTNSRRPAEGDKPGGVTGVLPPVSLPKAPRLPAAPSLPNVTPPTLPTPNVRPPSLPPLPGGDRSDGHADTLLEYLLAP